jgi:thymidine kinase
MSQPGGAYCLCDRCSQLYFGAESPYCLLQGLFQEDAESQCAGYVGSDRTRLLMITTPAFAGIPFEPVPALMRLLKLSAVCIKCGAPAIHTQRRGDSTDRVQVGAVGAD